VSEAGIAVRLVQRRFPVSQLRLERYKGFILIDGTNVGATARVEELRSDANWTAKRRLALKQEEQLIYEHFFVRERHLRQSTPSLTVTVTRWAAPSKHGGSTSLDVH